jgi:hypothetical protein
MSQPSLKAVVGGLVFTLVISVTVAVGAILLLFGSAYLLALVN